MAVTGDKAFVTFSYDDGRVNNYDIALPIHERYGVPASFAIIAGRTADPKFWRRHMNPHQIVDAARRGVEITSHGMYHRKKFTDLDQADLTVELAESQRLLQGFLPNGHSVDTLCVPFSASDARVRNEAAKYYSVIRGHGRVLNDLASQNPYVTSYALGNDTDFATVKDQIDAAIAHKKWLVIMLHGVVDTPEPSGKYDISAALLEAILEYITHKGKDVIEPASFRDMIQHRKTAQARAAEAQVYCPHICESGAYTLAEAEGYLITYHKNEQPTDQVVISFGGLPSKKTPKGFGSNFLLKQGYDHIFVAQEAGSQYQKLSLHDFQAIVEPYLQGKRVATYGSSLGAYAALYYGGAVNARIISSAPKNSAHRFMRKKRYAHIEFTHEDLKDVPHSPIPPLILFDPFRDEETNFIEKWVKPAYPEAYLLKQPYAGHTVLHTMQLSGHLKEFISTYLDTGIIMPFELATDDSYIWHAEKGRRLLQQGHLEPAKKHFQTSLNLHQNGEAAKGLARIYLKQNQPTQAQKVVDYHYAERGTHKGVPPGLRAQIEQALRDTE